MASWHEQWMSAYSEVNGLGPDDVRGDVLRGMLVQAGELIDEDNDARDRTGGGFIIRAVRRECGQIREQAQAA